MTWSATAIPGREPGRSTATGSSLWDLTAAQLMVADKGYVSAELDRWLAERGCGYYGRRTATASHARTITY